MVEKKIVLQLRKPLVLAVCVALAACAVGPDYQRPETAVPGQFKEAQNGIWQSDKWKLATPGDRIERGNWWELFGDEQLNALQAQLNAANQTVAAAEASYRQARAAAQAARADFYPQLSLNAAQSRGSSNSNSALSSTDIRTQRTLTLDASWELDVWGRIRREVEAGEASAQASAADLAAARLSAQAELAQNYFLLRVADEQQKLFDRTVGDYEKSLQLTKNQYAVGVAGRAEVAQAQAQLKAAQAQAADNEIDRAQLEHAIAILIGRAPADVAIANPSALPQPPAIPLTLPSTLLERRPDVAAAERRMVAANAEIGVARAAYFPVLGVSASGGYRSESFSDWLDLPNRFWSIGPTLALPLFDGGRRSAQSEQAVAAYDQTVANYRQTVLTGLQEVEDNLVAIDRLAKEVRFQEEAVAAAREALELVNNQYKAGTVSFLNVITAETTAFSNERTLLQARGRQFSAGILLIKALGGEWSGLDTAATPAPPAAAE